MKDFRSAFGDVPKEEEEKQAFGESISPIYHAHQGMPSIYIIHGDADRLVPIQQAETFLDRVKELGGVGQLDARPGMGHGWDAWEWDTTLFAEWFDKHLKLIP